MKVSAETLEAIVRAVRHEGGSADKRCSPRLATEGRARILLCEGSKTTVAMDVRDVSSSGIGLVHSASLPRGQQFVLWLPKAPDGRPRGILCRVMRWQPLSQKSFVIGAQFLREVTGAMENSGEKPQTQPADDQATIERIRAAILQ